MKFIVDIPDEKIPALRDIIAEMQDENPEDIVDEDLIIQLFYIYTGYHGSELDLRNDVRVVREDH
jgi:predicted Zn-dependent protease with MMP-like domain